MNMKKRMILISVLILLFLSACGQSTDNGSAGDDTVIKVGATPDGYPQYFYENEKLEGTTHMVTVSKL